MSSAALARSATGQRLTSSTTLITGPRRAGEVDGPEELHVVVIDNGRTNLLRGRYKEMLACIRCGAGQDLAGASLCAAA